MNQVVQTVDDHAQHYAQEIIKSDPLGTITSDDIESVKKQITTFDEKTAQLEKTLSAHKKGIFKDLKNLATQEA